MPTVKYCGENMIGCEAFRWHEGGDLLKISGKMRKAEYLDVLLNSVLLSGSRIINEKFTLQLDKNSKRTAKIGRDLSKERKAAIKSKS